jgi:competence protein ComEC
MLKIHFLNVGHSDCTVIQRQDNRLTVIDIYNGAELDLESTEQ